MKSMWNGAVTAVRTLTILPCPGRDAADLAAALPWFPAVGFLLGMILYGLSVMFGYDPDGSWPQGTAALLVLAGAVLTRGLHLDGLADWADGFWGGRNREGVLRIMKDPHTGAFGVVAIVSVLLAKYVCLAELVELGAQKWIVAGLVLSRLAQVLLASTLPYARAEGGTAAPFVNGAGIRHLVVAGIATMLLLGAWFIGSAATFRWLWLPAMGVAWVLARLLGMWFRVRIQGVTGDTLGASSELIEVAILALGVVYGIRL